MKKALKPKEGGEGCYRAGFEDKILTSDIVFLRAWTKVELPKFYNPVQSLLAPRKKVRANCLPTARALPSSNPMINIRKWVNRLAVRI